MPNLSSVQLPENAFECYIEIQCSSERRVV